MPNVGGVEYPYTPEGVAAAQEHARQLQMSPPLTSPSHPMAQRQVPDLQPAPTWMGDRNAWRGAASRSPSSPDATAPTYEDRYTIQNDPNRYYGGTTRVGGSPIRGRTYAESPSNPMAQRPVPDLQRYNDPPIQGTMSGQGILGTLGYSNEAMPSRQDLSNVVAYGDSGLRYGDNRIAFSRPQLLGGPSSPWYQPTRVPASTRPRQFGPTGQPMAQRVPAQKMVDNVVKQLPGG